MAPGELHAALRAAVEATRAASSAFRPAVAEYLYARGLAPLYDRLVAAGDRSPGALVTGVWRLMLETVATRRFGVSSERWRAGDYPDRYFPLVWLDVLPRCLPAMASDRRAAAVAALFNLGERLPRSTANALAEQLVARADAFVAAPDATLHHIAEELGLLGFAALPPAAWRRLHADAPFDCAQADPGFLPGAVAAGPGRRFVVVDALRPVALHLVAGPRGLVCRARGAAPPAVEATRALRFGEVEVALERRAITWRSGSTAHTLAEVDAVAPAALAANDTGDVVVIDAASTRVRWLRAGE